MNDADLSGVQPLGSNCEHIVLRVNRMAYIDISRHSFFFL